MAEVEVTALGHRGDGIALLDGGRVFVPGSLPGELVRGTVRAGRMGRPEVLRPADARVPPRCPHTGACGGCQLQHASDAFVAGWKRELVRAALVRAGLEAQLPDGRNWPMAVSPPRSRRRAVLSLRRGAAGIEAGFLARAGTALAPIERCEVLHPDILAALPVLRALGGVGLGPSGAARAHVIRSETGLDVDIRDAPPLGRRAMAEAGRIAAGAGLARLTWAGEPVIVARTPEIWLGRARVVPPPGGFLQATAEGEAALTGFVAQHCEGARRIADLFAGCGTFALSLSHRATLHAVEQDAAALEALEAGWRRTGGLKPLTVEGRNLLARPLGTDELAGFDAVVMDPPRAGARAQAGELARSTVPLILSVSCDPASFARDARILVDGSYRMGPILIVDQFRWSARVEIAAVFRRDAGSGAAR
ncbi:MAG: class I SAM-dependent RNA methyltransferase [Alphaproteobacteria bacterium]|nr:MAG: class I SAM-dependent RNA methyltransferase [Alphaproteobacteria bacterium]